MAKYTETFKIMSCALLRGLNDNGFITTKVGHKITNVRDLVNYLGVSSFSLYKWNEKETNKEYEQKDTDFFSEKPSIKAELETVFDTDKIIMELDNTYFMTLARALKIKNYRMPIKQLYLTIGSELIKRSGLAEKELRL